MNNVTEVNITSNSDLRSAVAMANSYINNICNSNNVEMVCNEFVKLKGVLNSIFKYKVEQLTK